MAAYIFMVPRGPRLDFITSWIPLAAEMFTARACAARATSAFGLSRLIAAIIADNNVHTEYSRETKCRRSCGHVGAKRENGMSDFG